MFIFRGYKSLSSGVRFLTFGGYKFLRSRVRFLTFGDYKSLRLGVINPYVRWLDFFCLGVRFLTFGGYKFLAGSGVINPCVLGL